MSENPNFLICLAGLPASGKTIFANILKSFLKKKFTEKIKIIDPDIIRKTIDPNNFDFKKEPLVREKNLMIIKEELQKGNIVISDDLNYYSSMRHDLKLIAEHINVDFFIIHISTPLKTCLKWNDKRGTPIPNNLIKKINKKFDNFNKYSWDYPFASYNLSTLDNLDEKVQKLVDRIDYNIFHPEKTLGEIEKVKTYFHEYNERLDKITRNFVGELLKNKKNTPLKKKIINMRKNFLKVNKNKQMSELEIERSFKRFLEKNLDLIFP